MKQRVVVILVICFVIAMVVVVFPYDTFAQVKVTPPTPIVTDRGSDITYRSTSGAFIYDKASGVISIYQKDDTRRSSIILDEYKVEAFELDTKTGWARMTINDLPCTTEIYTIDDINVVECNRWDGTTYLNIIYELSAKGLVVTVTFQNEDRTKDETHYFQLSESIKAPFDFYDESKEIITVKGFTFEPDSIYKLIDKSRSTYDGSELKTDFDTIDKLKRGHSIEFIREFVY